MRRVYIRRTVLKSGSKIVQDIKKAHCGPSFVCNNRNPEPADNQWGDQRIAHGESSVPATFRPQKRSRSSLDVLSVRGHVPPGPYIDQAGGGGGGAGGKAPAAPALPTNLIQILTGWAPGPNRYGFQLKFRCRSTSGSVQDLQNQAPNLIWREKVTYSRNDFSHRINPPSPTILPPGGVSFAAANTRRVGANLLEFNDVTDTHWMPTSAVRSNDFQVAPLRPGVVGVPLRPLPAIMESSQVYQYSPNGGTSWNYLAGAFNIRRTLFDSGGGHLRFRTQKTGIHSVTENYKP